MKRIVALSLAGATALCLTAGMGSAQAATAKSSKPSVARVAAAGDCSRSDVWQAGQLYFIAHWSSSDIQAVMQIDQNRLYYLLVTYLDCGFPS